MVRKGFIIDDKLVENPNGNFYTFDTVEDLKTFLETVGAPDEDEKKECTACGASNTEIEVFNNNGKCINCETPWNLI